MNDLLLLTAVPIVGFVSGFVNTLAGSGSLLTLPIRSHWHCISAFMSHPPASAPVGHPQGVLC